MKNILMIIMGVGLALGAAAAQPKLATGGRLAGGGGRPVKVIVARPHGYYPSRFGYDPFYSPFYGYNSFYYSPYASQPVPSKLDLEIEQINNDYHHEIAEVRHDGTLSKSERKQKIRDLRHEKENSVIEAKKGYYGKKDRDTE